MLCEFQQMKENLGGLFIYLNPKRQGKAFCENPDPAAHSTWLHFIGRVAAVKLSFGLIVE